MENDKPKSIEDLMAILRQEKGIAIAGAEQEQALRTMGYYHGYKGYRYIRTPGNRIAYTRFEELAAIYDFDVQLKALFYPWVMKIETALKNQVLEVLLEAADSASFPVVYQSLMDDYKRLSPPKGSGQSPAEHRRAEERFKSALKHRLDVRDRIYAVQTKAYQADDPIAAYYLRQDRNLPLWAIFELLSLGEFGHLVSCLNQSCRAEISRRLGIRQGDDTGAFLPQRLIYATKDLRNAIAHNDVIFDTRFRTGRIDRQIVQAITHASRIRGLTFQTVTDYLVLLVYQLKLLRVPGAALAETTDHFQNLAETLRGQIPIAVFHQILHTDSGTKMSQLKHYISR